MITILLGASAAALAATQPPAGARESHAPASPERAPERSDEARSLLDTFPRPARLRSGSIGVEDYPAAALRARAEGNVVARLRIGPDGRVRMCEIAASSGHAVLDSATCALIQRRFRFDPARDVDRNPIADVRTETVRWSIPPFFVTAPGAVSPPPAPRAEQAPRVAFAPPPPPAPPPVTHAPPASVFPDAYPRPARPRFGAIVNHLDYPLEALRAGVEGTVTIRYDVGVDGRIAACRVVGSSGSRLLDDATCAVAQRRLTFYPAHDAQGNPVTESRAQIVAWLLPGRAVSPPAGVRLAPPPGPPPTPFPIRVEQHVREGRAGPAQLVHGSITDDDYPASALRIEAQGVVEMRYLIGTDGRVETCEITASSGNRALDETSCMLITRRFAFLPAIGADGKAVTDMRTQRIFWRLPGAELPPPMEVPQSLIGREMLDDYPPAALRARAEGIVVVRYVIATNGVPEACEIVESSGNADLDRQSCTIVTSRFRFRPAIGDDGRPTTETRTQRIIWRLP
jgi:TonB family protein